MTKNTEVLPVRAIEGVVPGIPVFMMDGQKMPVLKFELSPAFGANQAVDLQGLFPVIGGSGILF